MVSAHLVREIKGIIDAKTIHQRPSEIEGRTTLGHWEGDLISGSNNSHIATLVDRKTRYTLLVQADGKDTKSVVDVYFCDPSSPWQRGTNENTNRLLRQYFPKKTSLRGFDQNYLDKIANKLNKRPRIILTYLTPTAMIESHVALTT